LPESLIRLIAALPAGVISAIIVELEFIFIENDCVGLKVFI
jgi:hypothetical protein